MILIIFLVFLLFPNQVKAAEPTITDFWNNKAIFQYSFKLTEATTGWTSGFDAGVHMEIVGNTWYLFTRKVNWGVKPEYCPGNETMNTEVRKSLDEGNTWNEPTPVIVNTPNTPWECAVTDGDVFYNPTENRWHYLFQCLGRSGGWSGCYATRDGPDPYGAFIPSQNNPVIYPKEIWSQICNSQADDCVVLSKDNPQGEVTDEGTFDIFNYQNGFYFVDFHGFDGVNGYRGIAKTTDFQTWLPVAADSVLDTIDAQSFLTQWDQNKPVGFGAGRILKNQGYYYLVAEAMDKSLICVPGQNWVVGMFRSQDLSSTNWEQLPQGNPFFTVSDFPDSDPNPLPCNPEYSGIFITQNGKKYFYTSRPSFDKSLSGIYFYELKFNQPLLGDIDGNGVVDLNDLKTVITNWLGSGICGLFNCDLINDNKINILDAATVIKNL